MRTAVRRMAIGVLGGTTLGYLAYGLRPAPQIDRQVINDFARWEEASLRVRGRIQGIREELEKADRLDLLANSWAGVYQAQDRSRDVVALSPSGRAAMSLWLSCIPPTRGNHPGRIVVQDGSRLLIEWEEDPMFGPPRSGSSELCFITWGDRRMLVPQVNLAKLRETVRTFEQTGKEPWMPRCFVREGDEDRPVFGEPDWPPGFDGDGD